MDDVSEYCAVGQHGDCRVKYRDRDGKGATVRRWTCSCPCHRTQDGGEKGERSVPDREPKRP